MKKICFIILFLIFSNSICFAAPPTEPSYVRSTSHVIGIESSNNIIEIRWNPSSDSDGDLKGYLYLWDNLPNTEKGMTEWVEKVVTNIQSPVLADGSWYFYIRAFDEDFITRSKTVHTGPFIIKTQLIVVGDINNDKAVDLKDAILGLKVFAGTNPEGIQISGDVNSDNKIGLEEVIYALQKVSGLR